MVKRTEKGFLILGAAGRDFHGFNVFFRSRPQYEVVGFTAAQIPEISCRLYSPELSGELYPDGLSIWPEDSPEEIIKSYMINRCILAYSDLSNQAVMDLASRVLATGTDFGFSVAGIRCWNLRSRVVAVLCSQNRSWQKPDRQVRRRLNPVGWIQGRRGEAPHALWRPG